MGFSTKFSLPSFRKQLDKLTDNQKSSIKRVGFGNLLHIPNQVLRRFQLTELMERWSCEKGAFVFPPGEITITLLDVVLILGLRVIGEPVVLKGDIPFTELEKEFGVPLWNRTITVTSLKDRLESLGERDDDYFVRVFLLYCFGTLLFPNANGKVDSRYLSFLQNLDKVSHFAWGAAVLTDLCDCLSERKRKKISLCWWMSHPSSNSDLLWWPLPSHNIQLLIPLGWIYAKNIWCYEHILIGRPKLLDCSSKFPRIGRWEVITRQYIKSNDDCQFAIKVKELDHTQIIWKLQPTLEETQINVVMELALEQECSLTDASIEKEHDARSRPGIQEQSIDIEIEGAADMVEALGEEEQMRQLEKELMISKFYVDVPSTSHQVPEVPESQGRSTVLINEEDDLNTKKELEVENLELKRIIVDLKKENLELKVAVENQRKEMKKVKEENVELMCKVENLQRENQLSVDRIVSRLERIVLDENVDE